MSAALLSCSGERRDVGNGDLIRRAAHRLPVEILYVLTALDAPEQMDARTDIPERGTARILPPDDAGKIVAASVSAIYCQHKVTDIPTHGGGTKIGLFADRPR